MFIDKLTTPGEYFLMVQGSAGPLETVLTVPTTPHAQYVALLGHPHSLQGGTMNNKVVTTTVRAFKDLNIPSIRFNFRGVGKSEGTYDAGVGESEDMLQLARNWQQEVPDAKLLFAGFSFGSYVAYRAAAQFSHAYLLSIAPPVNHYNFLEFAKTPRPWVMIQGEQDEVVPLASVVDFAQQQALELILFPETGHFFHGNLIQLKEKIIGSVNYHLKL